MNRVESAAFSLFVSLVTGIGGFLLTAHFVPGVLERWNVGIPAIGLVCSFLAAGLMAILICLTKIKHAQTMAIVMFLGIVSPWAFRLLAALWEFIQGAGI